MTNLELEINYMKNHIYLFGILIVALITGCATSSQVANMQGHGKKTVFDAPYETVWVAAIDAAQAGDLEVHNTDKERGFIGASRGMRLETMGEKVGIWVTGVSPTQTQVEVVSKQAGLPMLWFKNWEKQILSGIAANLTRDPAYIQRSTSRTVDPGYRNPEPYAAPRTP